MPELIDDLCPLEGVLSAMCESASFVQKYSLESS